MKIEIEFWGITRRLAGADRCRIEVPSDSTVQVALAALPAGAALAGELERCAFAVGTQLVAPAQTLQDGDVLSILPPVSGG